MDLHEFFATLARTPFSHALNASQWAFAAIEMGHLLALAALGGSVLVVNLAVFGIGLRQPAWQVAAELRRLFVISLAAIVLSGVLMVLCDPLRYYANDAFRIKMVLLVAAIVVATALTLYLRRTHRATGKARALAALSLLLWLSVGLAGRLIGFI